MTDVSIEKWKQANQVYAELLDLTVSDALQQLSQMHELDDEMKSLVLSLISSGNQTSQFFKKHVGDNFQLDEAPRHQFKAGDQVGGYELMHELGKGGMAMVYQAKKLHAESQKPVAIKLFNHRDVSHLLLNRFSIEQEILSELSHPHIVNMHHGGTSESGVPFIVMELIQGAKDIDQYAIEHQASLKKKVAWIVDAARAIAYAHQNLIVHRDIKPSNLMIDTAGHLKVVDFGIAKLMTKEDAPQKTTIMALTPSFAAPEQINSGQITVATDVFSLAAVCLALLIEDQPLPTDRLLKSCATDEAHLRQVLHKKINDQDLRNILNCALQHEPRNRYRNMELFAADLSAWLADKPVSATRDSWAYRVKKFAQRRQALSVALVALLLSVLGGLYLFSVQYQQTMVEVEKTREVKDFMLNVFSYADPDQNSGQMISALDLLSLAEDEIQFRSFSDDQIEADILGSIGAAFLNLGAYEKAGRNLQKALQIDADNTLAKLNMVQLMLDRSEPDQAAELLAELATEIDINSEKSSNNQADYWLLKASHSTFGDNNDEGIAFAQKSFDAYQALDHYAGMLISTRVLTEKMANASQTPAAVEVALNTMARVDGKISPVNSELLRLRTTLVYLYTQLGNYEAAETEITGVIEAIEKTLGESHPATLDALTQRAMVYKSQGQIELAMQDAKVVYAVAQEAFGETSQMAQQGLSALAQLNFISGQRQQAQQDLEKVVSMSIKNYGENHRMTLGAQSELANYLSANGRSEEAIDLATTVRQKYLSEFGPDNHQTILSTNTLLKLLAVGGRVDDDVVSMAKVNNQRAIDALSLTHPQTAYSFFVLGNVYSAAGLYEQANQAYIGLIDNQLVQPNNPRYVALTASIASNYQQAENLPMAKAYAQKSHQASAEIFGEQAVRTIQMELMLLNILLTQEDPEAQQHLQKLQDWVAEGVITEPILIDGIQALVPQP